MEILAVDGATGTEPKDPLPNPPRKGAGEPRLVDAAQPRKGRESAGLYL